MLLRPPPWIADRGGWYRHGAWSLASAAAESGIGLWLRELTEPVGKALWLGVMAVLLAARVVLSWRRDLDRERLALETGNAFHRRLWARGSDEGQDPSWLSREGREWIESGTRAALEWRTAAATLLLSVPLLVWLAPWITLAVLAAAVLLGRWAREKSRTWKSLADAERDSAERMATGEDWAWRSIPQMRPAGWSPLVARARRRAFLAFLWDRMERARRHLAWGAGGEASAHVAGWLVGAAAVLSWATGRMPVGSLLAFLGISLLAYRPVREAGRLLPHLRRAREAWSALATPPTFRSDSEVRILDLRVAWPHAPAVLSGLRLSVPRGSLVVAHGPNGCGKSTLLSAIAGAALPLSGTVTRPRRIFWMAQEPVLPPISPALWTGIGDPSPDALDGLLGLLFPDGIPPSLDWKADIPEGGHELSRGQRARLCLLAAAARPRSLWLLDEPVSALPPGDGIRILREVLARRGRATAILAVPQPGPDLAEIERLWEPGGERRGPVVSLAESRA